MMKIAIERNENLAFEDVLIKPLASSVLPHEADVSARLTKNITLNIPIISAAMDTVTEASMAIAMAQMGGLGVIHRNMPSAQQAEEVQRVKRFESGIVVDPITIAPQQPLSEALALMRHHSISGIPVIERDGTLVGILTNRDTRFILDDINKPVCFFMTKDNLITVKKNISQEKAKEILYRHRIEKLLVVDENNKCIGLITAKDIEKTQKYPYACKDKNSRLRVGAATTVGDKGYERAALLVESGVDVLIVDTAHGHSIYVTQIVQRLKRSFPNIDIIAGNVATAEATQALIDAGADAVKVGIGPGSICTTRVISGVGVPQLSAIISTAQVAKKAGVPIIADGGICFSGDIAKALAGGCNSVMIGSLLAGTDESPGEVYLHHGRSYKSYRGMGSVAAMALGSADRYFQDDVITNDKLVPEGIEAQVPYRGSMTNIIHQMLGGLRAAMGYTGSKNLTLFHNNAKFIRISPASLREGHVHDVSITKESPNYPL